MTVRKRPLIMTALLVFTIVFTAWVQAEEYTLDTWASDFDLPWSIAFLPDGSALVTELGGKLFHVDASGQAGAAARELRALETARGLLERAQAAHRDNPSGDNIGIAVLWLEDGT